MSLGTETERAQRQIAAAKKAGCSSTTITLCPLRRKAAEFNLILAGYRIHPSRWDDDMTVVVW